MPKSIVHIKDNVIINITVGPDNWEKIYSRENGQFPLEELNGDIYIGAIKLENGSFGSIEIDITPE